MSNSPVHAAHLVPAARWRPGFATYHPNEGWAERRQAHRCSGTGWPAIARQDARKRADDVAGRAPSGVPASLNAGGTRASRRSTVTILGQVPRFHLRHCLRIRAASSSRPGRSAWRAGYPTSRDNGNEPQPRDATPRSAYRIVSRRRPSLSRDDDSLTIDARWRQLISTICGHNCVKRYPARGSRPPLTILPHILHRFLRICLGIGGDE
jgi:hypothetical protein